MYIQKMGTGQNFLTTKKVVQGLTPSSDFDNRFSLQPTSILLNYIVERIFNNSWF